jgi:hypothetical protein
LDKTPQFDSLQPRFLRYRTHYKVYLVLLLTIGGLILSFWGHRLTLDRWHVVASEYAYELWISGAYFVFAVGFYFLWLRKRLDHSVQVFSDKITIHHQGKTEEIMFHDIDSVVIVGWSLFYLKTKSGFKHFFSSSLERVDYVWEGIHQARPELIKEDDFISFRTKLVQYDHHQKRKEWFFRHKLVDVFNWIILPAAFMVVTYLVQSREILVHQPGMYFFRLCMYSLLVILVTTFMFSFVMKKFVFDKRIKLQMGSKPEDKIRDLEFEGVVLHRSKMVQMMTAAFLFSLVMRSELNLFSVTRVKEELASFNIKQGHTLLVDNRYNCIVCKFPVRDGDLVVFGKGTLGQIMATEGDMVGQIAQDRKGRIIASENIQEVPKGHVAVKLANQNDVVMVQVEELIGKIQK